MRTLDTLNRWLVEAPEDAFLGAKCINANPFSAKVVKNFQLNQRPNRLIAIPLEIFMAARAWHRRHDRSPTHQLPSHGAIAVFSLGRA